MTVFWIDVLGVVGVVALFYTAHVITLLVCDLWVWPIEAKKGR